MNKYHIHTKDWWFLSWVVLCNIQGLEFTCLNSHLLNSRMSVTSLVWVDIFCFQFCLELPEEQTILILLVLFVPMEALLCLVAAMYEKRVVQHSELVPSYVQLAYLKTQTQISYMTTRQKNYFSCASTLLYKSMWKHYVRLHGPTIQNRLLASLRLRPVKSYNTTLILPTNRCYI